MLQKFLRDVVVIVVGKQAESISELLNAKKHVNEFNIAKKMNITINQARNILYRLSDYGLVSSIRKKDKKKGWYTYFWKFETIKVLEFLRDVLKKKVRQLNSQVQSRETKTFYICERCNIEMNEENALIHDFLCDECGDVFTVKDNTKLLREFSRHLNRYSKELEMVNKMLEDELEKQEKEKEKILKKEAKEKSKKKALKKVAKKKVVKKSSKKKEVKKKAVKKKVVKKIVKKKTVKKKVVKKKVLKKKITKKK